MRENKNKIILETEPMENEWEIIYYDVSHDLPQLVNCG